jgi:hypothetical protein
MDRVRYLARLCAAFAVGGLVVLALASTGLTQSPVLIAQAGIVAAAVTLGAAVRRHPARRVRQVRFVWLGLGASLLALGGVLVANDASVAGIAVDALAALAFWLAVRGPARDSPPESRRGDSNP